MQSTEPTRGVSIPLTSKGESEGNVTLALNATERGALQHVLNGRAKTLEMLAADDQAAGLYRDAEETRRDAAWMREVADAAIRGSVTLDGGALYTFLSEGQYDAQYDVDLPDRCPRAERAELWAVVEGCASVLGRLCPAAVLPQ